MGSARDLKGPKGNLLTEDEVAEWLKVPPSKLQKMRSKPHDHGRPIPFVKVGGLVRYREEQVQKWIDQHTYDDNESYFEKKKRNE